MFTFLSRMYDENPTILSVMCGSTVLLWIYFVFSDFLPDFFTEDNRFDITLPQPHKKKPKSSKILKESLCKRIAWINGKQRRCTECSVFSRHSPFLLTRKYQISFINVNKKLYLIFIYLHSANRMQQIFHAFCGTVRRECSTGNMERFRK